MLDPPDFTNCQHYVAYSVIKWAGEMNTPTFVFMIATYWVGGSAPTEGGQYLATGQRYNNKEFVAAHRTLPFGTILHVCLRRRCVSVVVKDRGPFLAKMDIERRIDLYYGAAKALGMLTDGRQRVRVSVPLPRTRPEIDIKLAGRCLGERQDREQANSSLQNCTP